MLAPMPIYPTALAFATDRLHPKSSRNSGRADSKLRSAALRLSSDWSADKGSVLSRAVCVVVAYERVLRSHLFLHQIWSPAAKPSDLLSAIAGWQ